MTATFQDVEELARELIRHAEEVNHPLDAGTLELPDRLAGLSEGEKGTRQSL